MARRGGNMLSKDEIERLSGEEELMTVVRERRDATIRVEKLGREPVLVRTSGAGLRRANDVDLIEIRGHYTDIIRHCDHMLALVWSLSLRDVLDIENFHYMIERGHA